jgi:hypothetical protein
MRYLAVAHILLYIQKELRPSSPQANSILCVKLISILYYDHVSAVKIILIERNAAYSELRTNGGGCSRGLL